MRVILGHNWGAGILKCSTSQLAEWGLATVDLAYSTWKDSQVHPWKDGHYLTADRWFGCSKASEKYKCAISKFKQLQKLYQSSRPLCKHEVASHVARAISYGNWYPCRCAITRCALQFWVLVDPLQVPWRQPHSKVPPNGLRAPTNNEEVRQVRHDDRRIHRGAPQRWEWTQKAC